MNVLIYKRVSTKEQKDNGFSLEYQDEVLKKYCEIKGHTIVGSYEEDFSAKTFNRPAFQKLLAFVKANRKSVDMILFTKWDRFSRNIENALTMIRELKAIGVIPDSIEQSLDLSNPDNKAMLAFYLVFPEIENDKNSQRTSDGMHKARKLGAWIGKSPFGYDNHRDELKVSTLIPNEKAILVVEAFNEVSKNVEPMDSIRRKMSLKSGMDLCKQSFLNMLKNQVYIGKVHVPAYKKEEETYVRGLHNGIIDEAVFYRVQDVIKGRRRGETLPSHKNESFPLRNFLVCGNCGQNLNGSKSTSRNGKKYPYYHCRKRCPTYLPASTVEQRVIDMLGTLKVSEPIILLFAEIIKDAYGNNEMQKKEKQLEMIKQKGELQAKIIKAEDRMLAGDISMDNYDAITKRLNEQMMNLNTDILVLNERKENPVNYLDMSRFVLTSLDELYVRIPYELKRVLVGSLFPQKIIISKDECRTASENEVLGFLAQIQRGTDGIKANKPPKLGDLSTLAPPPGLEPGTP
jgi:site-specific DNA recombinase